MELMGSRAELRDVKGGGHTWCFSTAVFIRSGSTLVRTNALESSENVKTGDRKHDLKKKKKGMIVMNK